MKLALAAAPLLLLAHAAAAQTVEELQASLEAERQINALLQQRIETLEAELAGRTIAPPARAAAPAPARAADDPDAARALERALVQTGTAVLPQGTIEVAPGLSWSHSGSSALGTQQDVFAAVLDLRMGLPQGWMVGARLPLVHADVDAVGDNTGVGDISATVSKSLVAEGESWPSIVASLAYSAPTGDDFVDDAVPLGSGFHAVTGQLAAVRTIDPVAFFGDVSYTHSFAETISGGRFERGGTVGFGLGATLAVTPDISLSTAFDLAFAGAVERNGVRFAGSDVTLGQFTLSSGFVLSRDVFLVLSGGVGVTDDSPDLTLGASLPIRF